MAAPHVPDPVFLAVTPATEPDPEPERPVDLDPEPVDDMHPADRARMNAVDAKLAQQLGRGDLRRPECDPSVDAKRRLELLGRVSALVRERGTIDALPADEQVAALARWERRWRSLLVTVDSEVAMSHNTNT